MSQLKLKGATSGDVTLKCADVAGTTTATFPATTGNVVTTGDSGTITEAMIGTDAVNTDEIKNLAVTQGKIADEAVNEAKLQISNGGTNGMVLSKESGNTGGLTWVANGTINQILQTTQTSEIAVNTTTYTNIGLSQAITPSSTSSKILVMVNVKATAGGAGDGFGFKIVRTIGGTATDIYVAQQSSSGGPFDYGVTGEQLNTKATLLFLDEPNSTSAVTYRIDGARHGSSSVFFHPNTATTGRSQMILLEVGA